MGKKKSEVAVPKDTKELEQFMSKLGEEALKVRAIKTKLAADITALGESAAIAICMHEEAAMPLLKGIYEYAKVNRRTLTDADERKMVQLISGAFSWRLTPPSVEVERGKTDQDIVATLEELGLEQFIRRPPAELDRAAMLSEKAEAAKVPGITIEQHENFYVRPNGLDCSIVMESGRARKLKFEEDKK